MSKFRWYKKGLLVVVVVVVVVVEGEVVEEVDLSLKSSKSDKKSLIMSKNWLP